MGYDVLTTKPDSQQISNQRQYEIYQRANDAIGAYYNTDPAKPIPTQTGVADFFTGFADDLIRRKPWGWQDQLAVGVRALLALSFDASPLYTALGVGFSNVANPFVGLPAEQQQGLQIYVGQEFQIPNGYLPDESLRLTVNPAKAPVQDPPKYLTEGFFELDPQKAIRRGDSVETPPNTSWTWNGGIQQAGTASTAGTVEFQPACAPGQACRQMAWPDLLCLDIPGASAPSTLTWWNADPWGGGARIGKRLGSRRQTRFSMDHQGLREVELLRGYPDGFVNSF